MCNNVFIDVFCAQVRRSRPRALVARRPAAVPSGLFTRARFLMSEVPLFGSAAAGNVLLLP